MSIGLSTIICALESIAIVRYLSPMAKSTTKRMGRPPGSEYPHLLHVRISGGMMKALDEVSDERLDRPTTAQLVREGLTLLIERERKERRK